MYSTASAAWLGATCNASKFGGSKVGTMLLNFSDANNATMTYAVNGLTQSKAIVRQVF